MESKKLTDEDVFAGQVRKAREAKGLTQAELAQQLTLNGIPSVTSKIAKIETGARALRLNEAAALSRILGVPLPGAEPRADDEGHRELERVSDSLHEAANEYELSLSTAAHRLLTLASRFRGQELGEVVSEVSDFTFKLGELSGRIAYETQCIVALVKGRELPLDPDDISESEREARLDKFIEAGFVIEGEGDE